jgi:tRNA-specific 2-thiouridylase
VSAPRLPAPGERVVVAMSGGVDSSVAAALLVERGCDVIGITLSLYEAPADVEGGCCTPEDILDARRVCRDLGIRHYLLNERAAFEEAVIRPFVDAYRAGLTPNPCVRCNDVLKFDRLLARTRSLDARWLATGHYARLEDGTAGPRLRRGLDRGKDQSYFLHGTPLSALQHLCFPVGGLDKDSVRREARRLGVRVGDKPDSMDVCFVPDGRTAEFVAGRGGAAGGGEIVAEAGVVLGRHDGVHAFTVGQRRGLGLAAEAPLYVRRIDAARRRLVVATADRLEARRVIASPWSWIRRPIEGELLSIQVRHRGPAARVARLQIDDGGVDVSLAEPVRALAPGQAAVLYGGAQGEEVLGGGTILAEPAARSGG